MRSHLAATAAYEPISMSHQLLGPDSSTLGPLARAVAPMCATRAMRAEADLIGPEAKRECRAVVISQQAMYEHQRHRTMSGIKEGMGWCLSGFKKRADTTHDGCDWPGIR